MFICKQFIAAVIVLFCATLTSQVAAATLWNQNGPRNVIILKVDKETITFRLCKEQSDESMNVSEIVAISFGASCSDIAAALPPLPPACEGRKQWRYWVRFRNGQPGMAADSFQVTADGNIHLELNMQLAHGPSADIGSVVRAMTCAAPNELVAPSTFCIEPKQFAVNFSYDAPLPNQILTRGFSFYLETGPEVDAASRASLMETARAGFGTAINIWTSSLWQRRERYDRRLAVMLEGMASHSATVTMFIPPQVIALSCPHSATFVIRVYMGQAGPFARPPAKELFAAFAANPGRTILLNYFDYKCWQNALFRFVLDDASRCVNITPILMHELGHAFGLGHEVDEVKSIMNPLIIVTTPSDADLDRLAAKLMESVSGTRPGTISPFGDDGAKVE